VSAESLLAKGTTFPSRCCIFTDLFYRFFPAEGDTEQKVVASVLSTPALVDQIGQYFFKQTRALVEYHSYPLVAGNENAVDVIRDVLRNVVVHWVASDLVSYLDHTSTALC